MEDAAMHTASLGPILCLVFFVPLWGPSVLFGETLRPGRRISPRDLRLGDIAGGIPLLLILAFTMLAQPSSVPSRWQFISSFAVLILSLLLWFRSIQFAAANDIHRFTQRSVVCLAYPAVLLAMSYTVLGALMVVSCLIKYEPAAFPFLVCGAVAVITSLPACWQFRLLCIRFAAPKNA